MEESKEELVLRQILEIHQKEREVLFANEAFLIGILQAISGGSVIAALAQADKLITLLARGWLLFFVTAMGIGVVASVLAALWKHQYKMWQVKATVSASQNNQEEAIIRTQRSQRDLGLMRFSMYVACWAIVGGTTGLLAGLWVMVLCPGGPGLNSL